MTLQRSRSRRAAPPVNRLVYRARRSSGSGTTGATPPLAKRARAAQSTSKPERRMVSDLDMAGVAPTLARGGIGWGRMTNGRGGSRAAAGAASNREFD